MWFLICRSTGQDAQLGSGTLPYSVAALHARASRVSGISRARGGLP